MILKSTRHTIGVPNIHSALVHVVFSTLLEHGST